MEVIDNSRIDCMYVVNVIRRQEIYPRYARNRGYDTHCDLKALVTHSRRKWIVWSDNRTY